MEYFALCIGVQAHLHILNRSNLAEEAKVLEGSANTNGGAFIRRHGADVATVEENFAAGLADMTRNQVYKSRLASAIRPDEAMHIAGFQRQIHSADRHQPAKLAR